MQKITALSADTLVYLMTAGFGDRHNLEADEFRSGDMPEADLFALIRPDIGLGT
jgi:hypothetical protein